MTTKLIKKNGKSYVQLPEEFDSLDEIELFQLKGNFWLISAPLGAKSGKPAEQPAQKNGEKSLSEPEKSVLRKLMKIRFADRTPSNVEKTFSADEKLLVRQLIKRGLLQVFYGKKYEKTGVFNISDEIYPLIHQEGPGAEPAPAQGKTAEQPQAPQPAQGRPPSYSDLVKSGWTVIPNFRDAEQFSYDLKKAGVAQNVKGVRAFDGKFYVATNTFIYPAYEKIKAVLEKKSEMHVEEIAAATHLEAEAVLTVLHLVAESGEVIEKKRGLFCLA